MRMNFTEHEKQAYLDFFCQQRMQTSGDMHTIIKQDKHLTALNSLAEMHDLLHLYKGLRQEAVVEIFTELMLTL